MPSFRELLINLYKCPICHRGKAPPIYQCTAGHCLCNPCYARLGKCETCGEPKCDTRSFLLEQIHKLVPLRCEFVKEGCTFIGSGTNYERHVQYCNYDTNLYTTYYCKDTCRWERSVEDMMDHCRRKHPEIIFFGSEKNLTRYNFSKMEREDVMVFYAYDTLFRFYWRQVHSHRSTVRFAMYYYGYAANKPRFSYEIVFMLRDLNVVALRITALCVHLPHGGEMLVTSRFLICDYYQLEQFCCDEGNLRYSIKIIDNQGATSDPPELNSFQNCLLI